MKQVFYILSLAVVLALTVAGGVLQGRISNRWGPSETMLTAGQKLDAVPEDFGGPDNNRWHLQSTDTMSAVAIEMLECTGNIVRTYENRRTGDVVNMFVIVGPTGPIALHTPEVCYSTQNYKSRDARHEVALPDTQGQDKFWALSFKSKTVQEEVLLTYYAWSTGDRWSAPNDARFAFAGRPYLYKIQLSSRLPAGTDPKTNDPCKEFLKDFLPVVKKHLIAPSKG
jgi:hypothetical protein